MRSLRLRKRLCATALILTAMFAFSVSTLGQQVGSNGPSDAKRAAEVEQALRDFYQALARGDRAAVDSFIIDEGFQYLAGLSVSSGAVNKAQLHFVMDKIGHYSFEVSDFTFAVFGNDVVVANYRLESKSLTDPKDIIRGQITDTIVQRNGKWQILVEHVSSIPNPIEPVISGMPNSWQRTKGEGADRYQITVDNSVKHSGNASATIKLLCGSDRDIWVALIQSITANEYLAKRIRLSGWMKTDDVRSVGLWMRVDGERHMLAFDNMANRSITGTTDWKMYSVVLDVPAHAKTIHFGVISSGPGQTWADDLKLEIVDNNVLSTNIASPEEIKEDQPKMMKTKVTNSRPVNLGFEDGVVH